MAVQQWEGLIAVNYAARAAGITRHMRVKEAKQQCPDLKTVHVQTLGISDAPWPTCMHGGIFLIHQDRYRSCAAGPVYTPGAPAATSGMKSSSQSASGTAFSILARLPNLGVEQL